MSLEGLSKEAIKDFLDKKIDDPDLYNDVWNSFLKYISKKDSALWNLSKDLNIIFKTFQANGTKASVLRFSYDFTYNYNNFKRKQHGRISNAFNFKAKGNISFDRTWIERRWC